MQSAKNLLKWIGKNIAGKNVKPACTNMWDSLYQHIKPVCINMQGLYAVTYKICKKHAKNPYILFLRRNFANYLNISLFKT